MAWYHLSIFIIYTKTFSVNFNEQNSTLNSGGHIPMIPVHNVATILGVNDGRAIKWLKQNGIHIHKIFKDGRVFQIEVDVTIDKLRAKDLMKKYPKNWEERYQLEAKDKTVCQIVIEELKGESWKSPTTIIKPMNESDSKIFKRLRA